MIIGILTLTVKMHSTANVSREHVAAWQEGTDRRHRQRAQHRLWLRPSIQGGWRGTRSYLSEREGDALCAPSRRPTRESDHRAV